MERRYTFFTPGKRLSSIWKDEQKTGDNISAVHHVELLLWKMDVEKYAREDRQNIRENESIF